MNSPPLRLSMRIPPEVAMFAWKVRHAVVSPHHRRISDDMDEQEPVAVNPSGDVFRKTAARWIDQLIDLTGNNKLLFFKLTSGTVTLDPTRVPNLFAGGPL